MDHVALVVHTLLRKLSTFPTLKRHVEAPCESCCGEGSLGPASGNKMHLMYSLSADGKRVYTLKKASPSGAPTVSAHPARFSPDDKVGAPAFLPSTIGSAFVFNT